MHPALAALIAAILTIPAAPQRVVVEVPANELSQGRVVDSVLGWTVVEVSAVSPEAAAAEMAASTDGRAYPEIVYQLLEDPAAEPLFDEQWAFQNRGQTGGAPGADIATVPAWATTTGEGAVVAVVDSGFDPDPQERVAVWTNPGETENGADDDGNGYVDDVAGWDFVSDDPDPEDTVGHGTGVAAVAAAVADGIGMTGTAPAARVMVLRACADQGCPASAVAEAIVYAADQGADVVNLSLGAVGYDPLVEEAVLYATAADVVVVSAAGNSGSDVDGDTYWTPVEIEHPAHLGVAWSDNRDRLAELSNFGAIAIELAAPGSDILVPELEGGYTTESGTSFAVPHVSGVAALMRSIDPDIDATDLAAVLVAAADPVDGLDGVTVSGARLDAWVAVQGARFRDIPRTTFASEIMWAAGERITIGCNPPANDHFCPDDPVTRGQMAALLVRALGLDPGPADAFGDDDTSEFDADIDALAAAGITRGCNPPANDRFCPDDPVSRGQMAAFLVRAYGLEPSGVDAFTDDTGSVFEPEIDAIAAAGLTKGCTATTYCPGDPVTREQMAALLFRAAP